MPKVSIILPTHNGEKYLSNSIESIIKQDFEDWELIIVNDCSADGSQDIINQYLKLDSRIKEIINKTNQKLPESLNIGFRSSKGYYLTWTSDDNIFMSDALSKMVNYLNKNKNEYMVCAKMDIIDENGHFIAHHCGYSFRDMLYNNCVGACFMYRRTVLMDIGEYDQSKFLVEDYDYWLRILFFYGKIGYLNERLYLYRIHNASLTGTREREIYQRQLLLKREYIENIIENIGDDEELLVKTYYELKSEELLDAKISSLFIKKCPILKSEVEVEQNDKVIVYGAGKYGQNAYEKYKKNIMFYADINYNLVGKEVNGVKIISIEEMIKLKKDFLILVAAHPSKIYSFIKLLRDNKVSKYAVFTMKYE